MTSKIKIFFRSWTLVVDIHLKSVFIILLTMCGVTDAASRSDCNFISSFTQKTISYKAHKNDTPEAKFFYKTCKNPYTEKFSKDANAALEGKKKYRYFSCIQCHSAYGYGSTGPIINGETYLSKSTDKTKFEHYASFTHATFGKYALHLDISATPSETTITTDDFLQIMAWLQSHYKNNRN